MKRSIARLQRLHGLQSQLADAATAERKRIEQGIHAAERNVEALQKGVAGALANNAVSWCERRAQLHFTEAQTQRLMGGRAALEAMLPSADAAEKTAIQSREQTGRILESGKAKLRLEEDRREQMRLDDLHSIAYVRARMTTPF